MRNRPIVLFVPLILIALLSACTSGVGGSATEVIEPAFTETPLPQATGIGGAIEATEEIVPTPELAPADDLEQFAAQVRLAALNRDEQAMIPLMSDPHYVSLYQSEGSISAPPNAAAEITQYWFVEGGSPEFDESVDQVALLDGMDPLTLYGDRAVIVKSMYVRGLGPEGIAEGLLMIEQTDDGSYRWFASMVAFRGFHPQVPSDSPALLLDSRIAQLDRDLSARDFEALRDVIAPTFALGLYGSEWQLLNRDDTIVQLQNYLPEGSAPIIPIPNPDTTPMLGGVPPQAFFDRGEAFLFSSGWGADAQGEAILVMDVVDGIYYWSFALISPEGF